MSRTYLFIFFICNLLIACNLNHTGKSSTETKDVSTEKHKDSLPKDALYKIEQAYIKYNSNTGNIREEWFIDYGKTQYIETYGFKNNNKVGGRTWIIDGYQYDLAFGADQMMKLPYKPEPALIFEKLSTEERNEKKLEKLGSENYKGYYCDVFFVEVPAPTTIWLYKGIVLKRVTLMGKKEIYAEFIEFKETVNDKSIFVLPQGLTIHLLE